MDRANRTLAKQWLNSARPGFCTETQYGDVGDCEYGDKGVLVIQQDMSSRHTITAECLRACRQCQRCNFVSVSTSFRDCSWYAECNLSNLILHPLGFFSGAVNRKHQQHSDLNILRIRAFAHHLKEKELELRMARNDQIRLLL